MSRHLVIGLDTREQRDGLVRFLCERQIASNAEDEASVAIEIADRASPGLATIVAAAGEWRCRARVGEVALILGESKTILRTET